MLIVLESHSHIDKNLLSAEAMSSPVSSRELQAGSLAGHVVIFTHLPAETSSNIQDIQEMG